MLYLTELITLSYRKLVSYETIRNVTSFSDRSVYSGNACCDSKQLHNFIICSLEMETLKYVQNITSLFLWFLTIVAGHKMEGKIGSSESSVPEARNLPGYYAV